MRLNLSPFCIGTGDVEHLSILKLSKGLFGLRWGFVGRGGRGLERMCEVVWIKG